MQIALFALPDLKPGRQNLKDPRLDQAHELVDAKKKTCAQVELVEEKEMVTADAILVARSALSDLLTKDLELVETRLGRDAGAAEKAALEKLAEALISEQPVGHVELSEHEREAISAHNFLTGKPVVVADDEELKDIDALLLRAFADAGWISFLTVGGKENRAWPIPKGATAWEAAGSIHTDIQKGLIRAEIISHADFVEAGGETQAKRANKQRLEMKDYVMQDYDVVSFRHNK